MFSISQYGLAPYARHFTIMDHVSDIEQQMKGLAHQLYSNPRIKNVTMSVDTLMGTSITYMSEGDVESPMCRAQAIRDGLAEAKLLNEKKNAIQDNKGPPIISPRAPAACARDIPGSLQQWVG